MNINPLKMKIQRAVRAFERVNRLENLPIQMHNDKIYDHAIDEYNNARLDAHEALNQLIDEQIKESVK